MRIEVIYNKPPSMSNPRMALFSAVLTLILLTSVRQHALSQTAATGVFRLSVHSFWTNYSVPATITARHRQSGQAVTRLTDEFGHLQLDLPAGEYDFLITAPGFESMESHSAVNGGSVQNIGFVLSPFEEPEEIKHRPAHRPGFTAVAGWIVDADTGKPLQGVRVRIYGGRAEEQTNQGGYFVLYVPSPPECKQSGVENFPGTGTLIAELAGYVREVHVNVVLPDDLDAGFGAELRRGAGTVVVDRRHKLDVCNPPSPMPDGLM